MLPAGRRCPRRFLRYVPRRQYEQVTKDLKPIYTAIDAEHAAQALDGFEEKWGQLLPPVVQMWREAWDYVIPFMAYPDEVRRVVYTTDESVKRRTVICGVGSVGFSLRCGRGRPPSEAQVLGLMPAAQPAPQRAFSVASRWRRPRPSGQPCAGVSWS